MHLVYWGLAVGGFVLVVSWLWGALVAFSLILLLLIGYEIWRQSHSFTLFKKPLKKPHHLHLKSASRKLASKGRSGAATPRAVSPQAVKPAVKSNAKPNARPLIPSVVEKSVEPSNHSQLDPLDQTHPSPSQAKLGGDRTPLPDPHIWVSEANEQVESSQNHDLEPEPATPNHRPSIIESYEDEPTVIRSEPLPPTTRQPVPSPFQPSHLSDEKTVMGAPQSPKPKVASDRTVKSVANQDTDITTFNPQNSGNQAKPTVSPDAASDAPTVIGPHKNLKPDEEQTML